MPQKKKRNNHYRDSTSAPIFVKPRNTVHGAKRYYILASLNSNNQILIELSASRQAALLKVKNGAKVIAIKSLKFKNRINDLTKEYVDKYQKKPATVFEKLDDIVI